MERLIGALVDRTVNASAEDSCQQNENAVTGYVSRQSSTEVDPAPVVMIRNAANNVLLKPALLTDFDAQTRITQFLQSSEASSLMLLCVSMSSQLDLF